MFNPTRTVDINLFANANMVSGTVAVIEQGAEYEIVEARESHTVLGTNGGAVAVDVVKCTGTQTPAAGSSLLSSTFNLKSTINTVVTKVRGSGLQATLARRTIKGGDRICLAFSGTQTAVEGVGITLTLVQTKKGTNRGR